MANKSLPTVGGFNDGKYIEPAGRNIIKMAKPKDTYSSITHKDKHIGVEYEIYELTTIVSFGKIIKFYLIEGMTIADAIEKIIYGYKKQAKRKSLT